MWISNYPESNQQILRIIALDGMAKASEISRLTGFHRQTVYKGLARLIDDGIVKATGEEVRMFSLSDKVNQDEVLGYFEKEKEYGILTLAGDPLDFVQMPGKFRGTFFDFGFIPTGTLYGTRILMESLPTSAVALFRKFTDTLKTLHYRLEEIYWTIDTYFGAGEAKFGVGIESFIKTISQEREPKKAAINISFVVQEWFGGYYGFFYNIQARWINHGLNKGLLDSIMLYIVLDKIPIAEKFAISWDEKSPLPFVEEYKARAERLVDTQVQLKRENILGVVERFGQEIILALPPIPNVPSRILARTNLASIVVEDLTQGQPSFLKVIRYKISPVHEVGPGTTAVELYCGMISDSQAF
jgi:DNA-binding Lrp family transcriptional regulator